MTKTHNKPKYKTNRAHERLMEYWNRSVMIHNGSTFDKIKNRFQSLLKLSHYIGKPKLFNLFN